MKTVALHILVCMMVFCPACLAAETDWILVFFAPGSTWDQGKPFSEQDEAESHIEYLENLLNEGNLLMGGFFADSTDSMIILRTRSQEQARQIAEQDPAVKAGVLSFQLRAWQTGFSNITIRRNRPPSATVRKDSPFSVGSPPSGGAINLQED